MIFYVIPNFSESLSKSVRSKGTLKTMKRWKKADRASRSPEWIRTGTNSAGYTQHRRVSRRGNRDKMYLRDRKASPRNRQGYRGRWHPIGIAKRDDSFNLTKKAGKLRRAGDKEGSRAASLRATIQRKRSAKRGFKLP